MEPTKIQDFRLLLLGDRQDVSSDPLIELLYKMALTRFLFLIGTTRKRFGLTEIIPPLTTPPSDLEWVLDEVVIKRFNRIGSEGYESQSVEGHSIHFESMDFDEYLKDITQYYDPGVIGWTAGKVVLI